MSGIYGIPSHHIRTQNSKKALPIWQGEQGTHKATYAEYLYWRLGRHEPLRAFALFLSLRGLVQLEGYCCRPFLSDTLGRREAERNYSSSLLMVGGLNQPAAAFNNGPGNRQAQSGLTVFSFDKTVE